MKPIPVEVHDGDETVDDADNEILRATVSNEFAGKRVDQALAAIFPDNSRSTLQQWIRDGRVSIDGRIPRQRDHLIGGESVIVEPPVPEPGDWIAENIRLDIHYQDEHILVINKPVGLVVHPGAGNAHGTLLNGLIYFDRKLATLPRAGIVHRLDKDTSGLLVIARNEVVRQRLIEALRDHGIQRTYIAIVHGVMISGGSVDEPIGRHSRDRKRMTVIASGKPAISHYRVLNRFRAHTQVRVELETGRTHQIRVHMSHVGFPLVGDPIYGGRLRLPPNATPELTETLRGFGRQALHASKLELLHPASGETLQWSLPVPQDMEDLITVLREDAQQHGVQ